MWILVDRERMFVTHKHPSLECINSLDYIESLHAATVTMDETHKVSFDQFSDYELKLLHENICGDKFPGFNKDELINKVALLCGQIPVSDVNAAEAVAQANALPFKRDKIYYRYLKGSQTAREVDDIFADAIVSKPGYIPAVKPNYVPRKQPIILNTLTPSTPNPHLTTQTPDNTQPKAPRATSSASTEAPKSGSKTRIVWDIADEIRSANPNTDTKTLRKMVAERCEQAGVNSSTMSVQYSKWRAHNNL